MKPVPHPARMAGGALSAAGLVMAALHSHPALAQTAGSYSIEVAPTAGYSTNPFLLLGDTDSPFLGLAATAQYRLSGETTRTDLIGRVSGTGYLRRYDLSSGYGASLNHVRRVSERIEISAYADFDSSIPGEQQAFLGPDPTLPEQPPPGEVDPGPGGFIDPDVGLRGQRSTSLYAGYDVTIVPGEGDQIALGADVRRADYSGRAIGADYFSYGANGSYSWGISPSTSLGAGLAVENVSYDGIAGSSRIFQPQLILSTRINSRWSLNAGVGASIVDDARPVLGSGTSTSLAASLDSCYNGVRSTFCAGFVQDSSPSGLGGVRTRTGANASYSYRLTEFSTATLGASYSRYGALSDLLPGADYWTVSAGYQRRISQRLVARAALGVRGQSDQFGSPTDFNGQVSLAYRYGNLR